MKIVIVMPFVYPYVVGGAQVHAYYLGNVLSRMNNVTQLSRGNVRVNQKIDNVRFVLVKSPDKLFVGSVITFFNYFHELSKLQPKIIILDFLTGGVSELAIVLTSILRRVPYVVTVHGHEIKKSDIFSKLFQRSILFLAKRIFVVSNELFNTVIEKFQISREKIVVVRNGFDREEIEQAKAKTKKCEERRKRVVYIGRLSPEKDPQTLIKAFELVLDNEINAELFVVGGGSLLPELKKYCYDKNLLANVSFTGQVNHQTALEYMSNSDLVVLSSLEEGTPLVLIEAMALGKPIVATNVGGVVELVDDRKNGILVPPQSSQQMANAICEIITNSELANSLSSNAIEKAKSLTWENVCEDYMKILENLAY